MCGTIQNGTDSAVIVGSSSHNERIEHLWCDYFRSVGSLFYDTFRALEDYDKLDPLNEVDMFCLHYVYLSSALSLTYTVQLCCIQPVACNRLYSVCYQIIFFCCTQHVASNRQPCYSMQQSLIKDQRNCWLTRRFQSKPRHFLPVHVALSKWLLTGA